MKPKSRIIYKQKLLFFFICIGNSLHFSSNRPTFRISIAALHHVPVVLYRTLCSLISTAVQAYWRFVRPACTNHQISTQLTNDWKS
jgi:hypothetical protein